ncbi:DUF7682 family zinc-binding protein [Leptolyngbya sp. AN03gr2]|uniref:DUF7682 family zinc-binding protein n=1 Tax=unclassified Leptolyngbya TaxID=2650499 RepID=UPI003D31C78C
MVRRRRKQRKVFACGHRGFGQYCHRCDQTGDLKPVVVDVVHRVKKSKRGSSGVAIDVKHTWQQRFERDPIELRHLPKSTIVKTRRILDLLDRGVAPGELKGRRFNFDRTLLRIPVSYRYRLLCRWQADRIVPLQVMTHEAYNAISRNKKAPRLEKG